MAKELTASGSLIQNDIEDASLAVEGLLVSMTGTSASKGRMATTLSDVAIPLGSLATLGWFFFKNRSSTTTITVKHASAGTAILSVLPGEFAMGRFGSGVTAPTIVGSAVEPGVFDYKIFAI